MMRERTGIERHHLRRGDRRCRARPARRAPRGADVPVLRHDRHPRPVDRAQAVDRHLLAAALQRPVPGLRHREGPRLRAAAEMGCNIIPPKEDIERLRAIYDSAISYHDQQVGRLVAQLKSWGIWDQTMLDHHRRSRRGAVRGSPLRSRRLAARLARARAVPGPRSGAVSRRHDRRGGRRGRRPDADDARCRRRAGASTAVQGEASCRSRRASAGAGRAPSYASQYEYAHAMRIGRWKIARRQDRRPDHRRHGRRSRRDHRRVARPGSSSGAC